MSGVTIETHRARIGTFMGGGRDHGGRIRRRMGLSRRSVRRKTWSISFILVTLAIVLLGMLLI